MALFKKEPVPAAIAELGELNRMTTVTKLKRSRTLYLFSFLAFLSVFVFSYIPMYGIVMAFQNYRPAHGFFGSEWVGFEHFVRFFQGHHFWRLIRNTLAINIYQLVAAFPVPIILALAFNDLKEGRFKKFSQTVSYAPHFISVVVFAGMIISFTSPTTGLVNHLLGFIGIDPIPFLQRPELFRHIYVWTGIWQSAGWGTIIYLAALSGVDPTLHEAAIIDGASRLQRNWYINIPSILPTIIILLIMNVGAIMTTGFERIFLLQFPQNRYTSDVIATYIFEVGVVGGQFSFGAAVGLFNAAVNAILLITVNKITKKVTEVGLW